MGIWTRNPRLTYPSTKPLYHRLSKLVRKSCEASNKREVLNLAYKILLWNWSVIDKWHTWKYSCENIGRLLQDTTKVTMLTPLD